MLLQCPDLLTGDQCRINLISYIFWVVFIGMHQKKVSLDCDKDTVMNLFFVVFKDMQPTSESKASI